MAKDHPVVVRIKEWVDSEYDSGRVTAISDGELYEQTEKNAAELGVKIG